MMVSLSSQRPSPRVWCVIASGLEARVYRLHRKTYDRPASWRRRHPLQTQDRRAVLTPVPGMRFEAEPADAYERKRKGHTVTPHGDITRARKIDLARQIDEELARACAEERFDELVLVAPARFLTRMKQKLRPIVKKRIKGEVPKDLTHDNPDAPDFAARIDAALS